MWPFKERTTLAEQAESTTQTLNEILMQYDVVNVVPNGGDPFIVVAPREPERRDMVRYQDRETGISLSLGQNVNQADFSVATMELGTTAPSPYTGHLRTEYNVELRGIAGLKKYDMMRRGDGTVRGTLRLIKTPVLAARWSVEPDDADSKRDVNAAKFIGDCFFKFMSVTWPQLITEVMLMCDFGYYMFEKVWEERTIDGKRRMVLKKLAPRHPMDVQKWEYDAHGGPAAVWMFDSDMLAHPNGIRIPIEKLLVFTFDKEAGNMEGISVLRSAYKHWFYKDQLYKIDAIQKERHGIGIPVVKLPLGWTPQDRTIADNLGRNLRTNERAHVVLPPNWELTFAKLEGHPVDALKSIEHHNESIRENILAPFMAEGGKDDDQTMFLKSTRFIADVVVDVFNAYVIPQLMDYNFDRVGMPKLRVRRIGEQDDWRTLSFALRNLIGAGVIQPDDVLEAHIRDSMDLPPLDTETIRETKTPQANPGSAPKAGPPRQNPKPVVAPPKANAGTDRSGG